MQIIFVFLAQRYFLIIIFYNLFSFFCYYKFLFLFFYHSFLFSLYKLFSFLIYFLISDLFKVDRNIIVQLNTANIATVLR